MRILTIFALVAAMAFPPAAQPQKPEPALTVDRLVALARENDPGLQAVVNERLQTRFRKDLVLPSRQYLLAVASEFGFEPGKKVTSRLAGTLSKSFTHTGTEVSVSHASTVLPDREEDTTAFRVEQALVRNAFGSQVRLLDKRLSVEEEILLLQVSEAYEDYVAQLIQQYLELQLAYLNLQAAESLYQDALRIQSNVEKKRRAGIAAPVEVDRIRLQSLERKSAVLSLKSSLEVQTSTLTSLIGAGDISSPRLEPGVDFSTLQPKPDVAIESLTAEMRSVRIFALQEKVPQLDLEYQKREGRPALDLILGQNYDQSTRFSTVTNRNESVVGLQLEMPFMETRREAEVHRAQYELGRSELLRKGFHKQLATDIKVLLKKIALQRELVEISTQKFNLAKRVLAGEKVRFQNGRIDLETLIQAQNALAENQSEHLAQQVELNKSVVEWLKVTDRLLLAGDRLNIKN